MPVITPFLLENCQPYFVSSIAALLSRPGMDPAFFGFEMVALTILWVMWLIGGAIVSVRISCLEFPRLMFVQNRWPRPHLRPCHAEVCNIVSTVIAFSWINWAIVTLLMVSSCCELASEDQQSHKNMPPPIQPPGTAPASSTAPVSSTTPGSGNAPTAGNPEMSTV